MTEFITKWNISGNSKTLKLPLVQCGTYDFNVDWGDGSNIKHIYDYNCYNYFESWHTYQNTGTYIVTITGTIKGLNATDTDDYQLLDVCQWGCFKLKNNGFCFKGCKKLQISATDALDLSEITSLEYMFCDCSEFNSPIGHWNVSNVKNMSHMFYKASSFNQPIGSWNVSNVTNMANMFYNALSFNQDISTWNVFNVTYMKNMLENARSLDDINKRKLLNWNIQSPEVVQNIFGNGKGIFCKIPIILFDWSEYNNNVLSKYNQYKVCDCCICMTEITEKEDWRAFTCYSTVKQRIPHCFHKDCIEKSLTYKEVCPCCRGHPIL
jgi:surface protein